MNFVQSAKRLMIWIGFLLCLLVAAPQNASAQAGEGILITADQVQSWLGRESQTKHPAVPNLKEAENATIKFFYETSYERRALDIIKTTPLARLRSMRFLPEETLKNINVYLLADLNTYFEAQDAPGRAPAWASGLSILSDDVILIRLKSIGSNKIEPERTLAHELNHVALRRMAGDAYFPHWFYEGLAMLATDDWGINRAETLAHASMSGNLMELKEIDNAFGKQGATVELAYAQSAQFVAWLSNNHGDDKMKQLIKEVAGGTEFKTAFIHAFERSPDAAFAVWKEAMSKNQSFIASLFSGDAIFFYMSLFAGLALIIALSRRKQTRKARLANMTSEVPVTRLPENLRHFGPFEETSHLKK